MFHADYAYDPLKLGNKPNALEKYRAAELIHARWAMLGAVGCFLPEILYIAGENIKGPTWFQTPFVLANGERLNWFTEVRRQSFTFVFFMYHLFRVH